MCTGLEILSGVSSIASLAKAFGGSKPQAAPSVEAPTAPAPAQAPTISAMRSANESSSLSGPSSTDLTQGVLDPSMLKLGKGTLLGS